MIRLPLNAANEILRQMKKNSIIDIDQENKGKGNSSIKSEDTASSSSSHWTIKKRDLLIIAVAIIICLPLGVKWYNHLSKSIVDAEFSSSLPLKFKCLGDYTAEVTEYTEKYNHKTYIIPDKVLIYGHINTITSIGGYAFSGCKELVQLEIPESVKYIGGNAFEDCANLDVIIYNSKDNVKVGRGAFDGCKSVIFTKDSHIIDEESDTPLKFKALSKYNATLIYDLSYKNLDSITIPEKIHINGGLHTVVSINDFAFKDCKNLKSITIPNTIKTISEGAFSGSGLTKIKLPNSISQIHPKTFKDCKDLRHIEIPNNVKGIGEYAFMNCGLTELFIPNSVVGIKHWAFWDCDNLDLTIDNSEENMRTEDGRIYGCKSVTYTK